MAIPNIIMEQTSSNHDKLASGITIGTAALSTIGSLLIIFTFVWFKRIKNYQFRLIVFLSISDLVYTSGNFLSVFTIHDQDHDPSCLTQSFLINIGGLSSIIWTSIIARNIFSATVLGAKKFVTKTLKYLAIGYLIPIIVSLIPFFSNMYGRGEFKCWIKNTKNNIMDSIFMLLLFYIPLIFMLIYNIYSYIKVIKFMKKYTSKESEMRFVHRLKYYPFVLALCQGLGIITTMFHLFDSEISALSIVSLALSGLQGFLNAIVYGMNSQVRAIWKQKVTGCCRRSKNKVQEMIKAASNQNLDKEKSQLRKQDHNNIEHVELEDSENYRGDSSGMEHQHRKSIDIQYEQQEYQ